MIFFFLILFINKMIAIIITTKVDITLAQYINVFIFSEYSICSQYSFSIVPTVFSSINFSIISLVFELLSYMIFNNF